MGLSCDLNSVLWTPWFTVPTLNIILCTIEAGTYIGDGDIGDQFHNFMLHPSFQSYAGLDFKHFPRSQEAHKGSLKLSCVNIVNPCAWDFTLCLTWLLKANIELENKL